DGRLERPALLGARVRRPAAPGDAGRRQHRPSDPRHRAQGREGEMSYIKKPVARHPSLQPNKLGLTVRDYEGAMSTLCAGCGHDSITAAITRAFFELDIAPQQV